MQLLENYEASMQFCQALMIIRNKITGAASNILNNYNTPFIFEAIIDRLDFTNADKRPLYVLEQEMLVLQQNRLTIDEFYDKVNEKLNAIINKINMSYSNDTTARAFIETNTEKALRTFITGLKHKRGEILYASNPKTLPEAYAKLQTITNDQERMRFVSRYNGATPREFFENKNPNFRFRDQKQITEPIMATEPMEIDQTSTKANVEIKTNRNLTQTLPNTSNRNQFKRNYSHQGITQNNFKHQKFNKLEEYAKTVINDKELSDTESCLSEDMSSNSSVIFLGE